MEKIAKIISRLLFCALLAVSAGITAMGAVLPSELSIEAGKPCGSILGAEIVQTEDGAEYRFGGVPIKPLNTVESKRQYLVPCGTPFGIKLRTEGVVAVSVGENSPAEKSGIKQGDIIISVNGVKSASNSDISDAIQLCPNITEIILRRGDSEKHVTAVPYEDCGIYKIGLWVRDSAAGLGTLTYYDPHTYTVGGLGHPVSDITTGQRLPVSSGEITAAVITDIVKGEAGTAGELCGNMTESSIIGELTRNTDCGIFGTAQHPQEGKAIPMAFRQEVKTGKATILTTVDGEAPEEYDIEIEHISMLDLSSSKSMVIRITDKRLLEKTGGIVCGMSGSPIIQNGMLVGAVTHVFLNDPARGYAVFCETMLENAQK